MYLSYAFVETPEIFGCFSGACSEYKVLNERKLVKMATFA